MPWSRRLAGFRRLLTLCVLRLCHGQVFQPLKFLTYNTLTLHDVTGSHATLPIPEVGMRITGRRDLLKAQLEARCVVFAGLQETRLPDCAVLPDSRFWMLHSPCTSSGQYGVALWRSKTVPYVFTCDHPFLRCITFQRFTLTRARWSFE